MRTPEPCLCGADDCARCRGPSAPFDYLVERANEEMIANAPYEPETLGIVLKAAFQDDPDLELQHELAAVLRRLMQGNWQEARDSGERAAKIIQQLAQQDDLFAGRIEADMENSLEDR